MGIHPRILIALPGIINLRCFKVLEELALYLGFGSLAGVLSGLFGIGGGVVTVPLLAWWFARQGFPPDSIMIMAVATSLATIVVTSVSSVHVHHRRGAVYWNTVFRMVPGILCGAVAGSLIARRLPVPWFMLMFGLFLLYVAIRLVLPAKTDNGGGRMPGRSPLVWAGAGIGLVSSILGIGGGTLSVPFLVRCRYSIHQAVAISAACGFPIALAGTVAYVALGYARPGLPPGSLGYVFLPAVAGFILASVPFASVGAHLAHRLPTSGLRRLFGVILAGVGGRLLWQSLQIWIGPLQPLP